MTTKRPAAAHAYAGLDRVLHEKARLAMLTVLLGRPEGVLFPELKQLCDLTDGNLARHLQVRVDSRHGHRLPSLARTPPRSSCGPARLALALAGRRRLRRDGHVRRLRYG